MEQDIEEDHIVDVVIQALVADFTVQVRITHRVAGADVIVAQVGVGRVEEDVEEDIIRIRNTHPEALEDQVLVAVGVARVHQTPVVQHELGGVAAVELHAAVVVVEHVAGVHVAGQRGRVGVHDAQVVAVPHGHVVVRRVGLEVDRAHPVHVHDVAVALHQGRAGGDHFGIGGSAAQFEEHPVHDRIGTGHVEHARIDRLAAAAHVLEGLEAGRRLQAGVGLGGGQQAFGAQLVVHLVELQLVGPL